MTVAAIDRWLAAPAPPQRLAAFRILLGTFVVAYFVVRLPVFLDLADASGAELRPVGILWWLRDPLPPSVVRTAIVVVLVAGVLFTAGVAFRITACLFAAAALVLTTYRSSQGQLLWFEDLFVLHVLLLAAAPAADAWALRRHDEDPEPSWRYGWWLRTIAVVTVCTYVVAGVAKLRESGTAWLDGESLRNHVAFSAARIDVLGGRPPWLASRLVEHTWVFAPLAVGALALELGAPLALVAGRPRRIVVGGLVLMHLAIALAMHVVFPYHLAGIGFAPLARLERLPATVARSVRSRS